MELILDKISKNCTLRYFRKGVNQFEERRANKQKKMSIPNRILFEVPPLVPRLFAPPRLHIHICTFASPASFPFLLRCVP